MQGPPLTTSGTSLRAVTLPASANGGSDGAPAPKGSTTPASIIESPPQRVLAARAEAPGLRAARWVALAAGAGIAVFWLTQRNSGSVSQHADPPLALPPAVPGTDPSRETMPIQALQNAQDSTAVDLALTEGLQKAQACQPGGQPLKATGITVTFAPSGLVRSARVEEPSKLDATVNDCILARLREVRIPSFDGDEISVRRELPLK